MRTVVSIVTALALGAMAPAPAAAQRADSALVGSWSGQAPISASWTAQRTLSVRLTIAESGSVTGWVGDAQLLAARLMPGSQVGRAMHLARRYAIDGSLRGAVIRAEGIHRDRVHISLDLEGQMLVGDLQTSGSYEEGATDLVLTAKRLVLQRVVNAASRDPRSDASPARDGRVATLITP